MNNQADIVRDVNDQKQREKSVRRLYLAVLAVLLVCLLGLECQAATGAKVVSFYGVR